MTGCGPDRECIHPPEEHRGAARIGRAKIAFFERDDVYSSPLLKHENVFYRVKKGDLFQGSSPSSGDNAQSTIQWQQGLAPRFGNGVDVAPDYPAPSPSV